MAQNQNFKWFPKQFKGYADLRSEKTQGERFYVSQHKIESFQKIFKEGFLLREAGENRFKKNSGPLEGMGQESPFSRYVKDHWELEKNLKNDPLIFEAEPLSVPEEIKRTAMDLAGEGIEFRFTWENRSILFENSLGWRKVRSEKTRVIRIDAKKNFQGKEIHLRGFFHNPSPFHMEKEINVFQSVIQQRNPFHSFQPGKYKVLLHPSVACVLIHELIGHPSEFSSSGSFEAWLQHKKGKIASDCVSVLDVAHISPDERNFLFDDEGVTAQDVDIIRDGKFRNYLLNLEEGYKSKRLSNGRGRARDFQFSPIPRMRNIQLAPGKENFSCLLSSIKDGFYLIGTLGSLNQDNFFQIQCQYGFRIEKGKMMEPILKPVLWGQIRSSLFHFESIGDDFCWVNDGGCLAEDQFLELSGRGAPHVLLKEAQIA